MLAEEDAIKQFAQWLYKEGYAGSTVPTYTSALRLVFRHLGDSVTQESLDETFRALRTSSRYSAAKRGWELFRAYAKTKKFDLPYGPKDGRRSTEPVPETPELPEAVLKVARLLLRTLKLSCGDIARIYWDDAQIVEGGKIEFPHPNGKKNTFISLDLEILDPLRNYAQPKSSTPLIPFNPGGTVPYPLELVLSGR